MSEWEHVDADAEERDDIGVKAGSLEALKDDYEDDIIVLGELELDEPPRLEVEDKPKNNLSYAKVVMSKSGQVVI